MKTFTIKPNKEFLKGLKDFVEEMNLMQKEHKLKGFTMVREQSRIEKLAYVHGVCEGLLSVFNEK